MKLGVIFVGYNYSEYVVQSLYPWANFKNGKDTIVIGTVSCPFNGYQEYFKANPKDNTDGLLNLVYEAGYTSYCLDETNTQPFLEEWQYRDMILQKFRQDHPDMDYVTQVDADELYSKEDIENLLNFIRKNPYVAYFRLSYKNYVFNEHTYLKDPLVTPHVYKMNYDLCRISRFYHDNEVSYVSRLAGGAVAGDEMSYQRLPGKVVPKEVLWVKHMTWLDCPKVRQKIVYQETRWGKNACSYWVNPSTDKLEFNPIWHKNHNLLMPTVVKE